MGHLLTLARTARSLKAVGPALPILWTAWLSILDAARPVRAFLWPAPPGATLPLPSPRFQRCYNRWKCQISRIRDPRPACSRLESWLQWPARHCGASAARLSQGQPWLPRKMMAAGEDDARPVQGRVSGKPRCRRRSRSSRMVSIRKFASASRYPESHRASFRIVVWRG